jgi:CBS domain-containing protein
MRSVAKTMRKNLKVRDAMSSPVVTVTPDATLEEVARRMLDDRVGCIVVVRPGAPEQPVGIVTETDFEVGDEPLPFTFFRWPRLFGKSVWSEGSLEDVYALARSRPVEAIMTSPVTTVAPDAPLWEAVETMVHGDFKRVPVVSDGRLVGIVTRHDLLKCLVPDALASAGDERTA